MTKPEYSLPVRIANGIFVISLVVLVFSGFNLHHPFLGEMRTMRYLHLLTNFLILNVLGVKLYLRLLERRAVSEDNSVKRMIYNFWFFFLIILALVTFSLYLPPASLFSAVSFLAGGLATIYLWHYFLIWILAATLIIYVYITLVEIVSEITSEA